MGCLYSRNGIHPGVLNAYCWKQMETRWEGAITKGRDVLNLCTFVSQQKCFDLSVFMLNTQTATTNETGGLKYVL